MARMLALSEPTYLLPLPTTQFLSDTRPTRLAHSSLLALNHLLDELLQAIVHTSLSPALPSPVVSAANPNPPPGAYGTQPAPPPTGPLGSAEVFTIERFKAAVLRTVGPRLGQIAVLEGGVAIQELLRSSPPSLRGHPALKSNVGAGSLGTPEGGEGPEQIFMSLRVWIMAISRLGAACPPSGPASITDHLQILTPPPSAPPPPSPHLTFPLALYAERLLLSIADRILSHISRVASRSSSTEIATLEEVEHALHEDDLVFGWYARMRVRGRIEEEIGKVKMKREGSRDGHAVGGMGSPISSNAGSVTRRGSVKLGGGGGMVSVPSRMTGDRGSLGSTDRTAGTGLGISNEDEMSSSGFEELISSGKTVKVSLTPDRLRAMERQKLEKARSQQHLASSISSPPHPSFPLAATAASASPDLPSIPPATSTSITTRKLKARPAQLGPGQIDEDDEDDEEDYYDRDGRPKETLMELLHSPPPGWNGTPPLGTAIQDSPPLSNTTVRGGVVGGEGGRPTSVPMVSQMSSDSVMSMSSGVSDSSEAVEHWVNASPEARRRKLKAKDERNDSAVERQVNSDLVDFFAHSLPPAAVATATASTTTTTTTTPKFSTPMSPSGEFASPTSPLTGQSKPATKKSGGPTIRDHRGVGSEGPYDPFTPDEPKKKKGLRGFFKRSSVVKETHLHDTSSVHTANSAGTASWSPSSPTAPGEDARYSVVSSAGGTRAAPVAAGMAGIVAASGLGRMSSKGSSGASGRGVSPDQMRASISGKSSLPPVPGPPISRPYSETPLNGVNESAGSSPPLPPAPPVSQGSNVEDAVDAVPSAAEQYQQPIQRGLMATSQAMDSQSLHSRLSHYSDAPSHLSEASTAQPYPPSAPTTSALPPPDEVPYSPNSVYSPDPDPRHSTLLNHYGLDSDPRHSTLFSHYSHTDIEGYVPEKSADAPIQEPPTVPMVMETPATPPAGFASSDPVDESAVARARPAGDHTFSRPYSMAFEPEPEKATIPASAVVDTAVLPPPIDLPTFSFAPPVETQPTVHPAVSVETPPTSRPPSQARRLSEDTNGSATPTRRLSLIRRKPVPTSEKIVISDDEEEDEPASGAVATVGGLTAAAGVAGAIGAFLGRRGSNVDEMEDNVDATSLAGVIAGVPAVVEEDVDGEEKQAKAFVPSMAVSPVEEVGGSSSTVAQGMAQPDSVELSKEAVVEPNGADHAANDDVAEPILADAGTVIDTSPKPPIADIIAAETPDSNALPPISSSSIPLVDAFTPSQKDTAAGPDSPTSAHEVEAVLRSLRSQMAAAKNVEECLAFIDALLPVEARHSKQDSGFAGSPIAQEQRLPEIASVAMEMKESLGQSTPEQAEYNSLTQASLAEYLLGDRPPSNPSSPTNGLVPLPSPAASLPSSATLTATESAKKKKVVKKVSRKKLVLGSIAGDETTPTSTPAESETDSATTSPVKKKMKKIIRKKKKSDLGKSDGNESASGSEAEFTPAAEEKEDPLKAAKEVLMQNGDAEEQEELLDTHTMVPGTNGAETVAI